MRVVFVSDGWERSFFLWLFLIALGTKGMAADGQEPLAAASHRTGLVISEINYHPAPRLDRRNPEMVEIYNSNPYPEDMSLFRISGSISYSFPSGFVLPGLSLVVLAAVPSDLQAVYGVTNVLGYAGELPNSSGLIRLRDNAGKILLEVEYQDAPPWPVAADGGGPSLVLARPSFGQGNPLAWDASRENGGSPGKAEPSASEPTENVVINEILANPKAPDIDYIELFNRSPQSIDISGCTLSDDPTRPQFTFPPGSVIGPRDFVALDEFVLQFAFDGDGETLYFRNPAGTRLIDVLRLDPQASGVALGRYPDGAENMQELESPTPWARNRPPLQHDLVINEIMFAPISSESRDEYVELFNRGTNSINLAGFQFADGIELTLPAGAILPPGGYFVIGSDIAHLRAVYPHLNASNSFGNYDGALADEGERIAIFRVERVVSTNNSDVVSTNLIYSVVDEVTYGAGGSWGQWARQGGSSLELIDARSDNRLAANWADSDESTKGQWTQLDATAVLDNFDASLGANQNLQVLAPLPAEMLVDDLEVTSGNGPNLLLNPGFEAGLQNWTLLGSHDFSNLAGEGYSGSSSLRLRAAGPGDTGPNNVRSAHFANPIPSNTLVRVRAHARWLAGSPRLELRMAGNGLDVTSLLPVPANLGTPGAANSRAATNRAPTIYNVSHFPVLPAADQPIRITAQVDDPNGLATLRLHYRIDPSLQLLTALFSDDGVAPDQFAGDGIYTALLPGQSAGTLVAFHLEATDLTGSGGFFPEAARVRQFPFDSRARECLVRVGEVQPAGAFATYHLWMTADSLSRATNRHALNSAPLEATFVYQTNRVIYGVGVRYGGGVYELPAWQGLTQLNRYDLEVLFPETAPFLGTTRARWSTVGDALGSGPGDPTALIDQAAQRFFKEMQLPYTNRRFIHVFLNGTRRSANGSSGAPFIMEDTEPPVAPEEAFPEAYQAEGWLEFNAGNSLFHLNQPRLKRFTTTVDGLVEKKLAPYRWAWPEAGVILPNNSISGRTAFGNLIDAFSPPADPDSPKLEDLAALRAVMNLDQWMRHLAVQHFLGNWNSYGYRRGANTLLYQNSQGKFELAAGDVDVGFGLGGGLAADAPFLEAEDPRIGALFNTPDLARQFLLNVQAVADAPFWAASFDQWARSRSAALITNGVVLSVDAPSVLESFVSSRRNFVNAQLGVLTAAPWALTTTGATNNRNLVTISGTAPLRVANIFVGNFSSTLTWNNLTNWTLTLVAPLGDLTFSLTPVDRIGTQVGAPLTFSYSYTGLPATPLSSIAISEIMTDAMHPGASFVEIRNSHPSVSFALDEWAVRGIDYSFPRASVLTNGQVLVLVKNRAAFQNVYGPNIPIFSEFSGSLDPAGQVLSLIAYQPPTPDFIVDRVAYGSEVPWPPQPRPTGASFQLIDPGKDHARVSNWRMAPATPGVAVSGTIPSFAPVVINEVAPNNRESFDNFGEPAPWIEMHNPGSGPVGLTNFFLTDNYTNLTRWPIPPRSVASGEFLVIWADGETNQATASAPHTNFKLAPSNGVIALVEFVAGAPRIVDYLNYSNAPLNRSYASYPNGQTLYRAPNQPQTIGNTNRAMPVLVNEWMASNTGSIRDPADNNVDDWFELYNPSDVEIDLGGYLVGDDSNLQFINAGRTLGPHSFLLVWADRDMGQSRPGLASIHASFRLSAGGDMLQVFATNQQELLDRVTFGSQKDDISQGRFPDGAAAAGILITPTPGAANSLRRTNEAPTFRVVATQRYPLGVNFSLVLGATDSETPPQILTYRLRDPIPLGAQLSTNGFFSWTYLPGQLPGTNFLTALATDNGSPPLSASVTFMIIIDPPARITQVTKNATGNLTLSWPTRIGSRYVVEWSPSLAPEVWSPLGDPFDAASVMAVFVDTTLPGVQRFYRIRTVQ